MYKVKKSRNRNYARPRRNFKKNSPKNRIDINKYIEKNLETKPEKPYENTHGFGDFILDPHLLKTISEAGYTIPTEIQDKTIPLMLEGKDMVGIAGTGTGKTAAFLIPIIQRLIEQPQNNYALIVAPTRELASQISDEFRKLTKGLNLYATSLIGGVSVSGSIKALKKTNHLVIGTPGRLIDMVERNCLPLDKFNTLVLDEFDRMLDMGFLEDVKFLNSRMKRKRTTLLFSATMDKSQKAIVGQMTNNPVEVKAGKGPQFTAAIDQDVVRVPKDKGKMEVLKDLIIEIDGKKIILFCETKRRVNDVCKKLLKDGIKADQIHGDKSQRAREAALRKFKKGHVSVLVATDVVARGIDVTDVSMVINYEVPGSYNDYIHRIGRTGRAGKTGRAITLID